MVLVRACCLQPAAMLEAVDVLTGNISTPQPMPINTCYDRLTMKNDSIHQS